MTSETTSASIASIAARGLRDPGSLSHHEIARVCASALTQRPGPVKAAFAALAKVFKPST